MKREHPRTSSKNTECLDRGPLRGDGEMNCMISGGLSEFKHEADWDDHGEEGKHIHGRQGSGHWPEELG